MSTYTDSDRVIAFSGIYQAARQVHDLAAQGRQHPTAFHTSLNSVFITQPESVLEVFGDKLDNIRLGLETLISQMLGSQRNLLVTRYTLGLIMLAHKLEKDAERLEQITRAIETARRQQEHFGPDDQRIVETLARAYQEVISPLSPRIIVQGKPDILRQSDQAARIRMLLLAGIRAAILWHQTGGSRWQLIWKRRTYLRTAQSLLQQLPQKPLFSPD